MVRSKGVTIAVKVPIKWESMTKRTKQRLRQIVGRDTRVIRAFLGVVEQHENELLMGRRLERINESKLDTLTITAVKVKPGYSQRLSVPHDFKKRFPRISNNEIQECRQTAVALYESYLGLRSKRGRKASKPCAVNSTRRIPRWAFSQRFKLFEKANATSRWWLNLRDSFDSIPEGRRIHDRLTFPLRISPFHLNQFKRGEVKALQIFTDDSKKWWVTFAVRVDTPEHPDEFLPCAVLGIDLGIKKAACTTLVTPTKVRETCYFKQKDKQDALQKLDQRISDLQSKADNRFNRGQRADMVLVKTRALKHKRENASREYDRILVNQLMGYITGLSKRYTLYIALDRLKGIRGGARRGNFKGRKFRGMIHRWTFARTTNSLKHQLAQLGWQVEGKNAHFRIVPENWTSIMCWKCGRKGNRPKQNLFVCSTCGNKCNADKNGSINIAGRLITITESLHSVRGLGFWTRAIERARSSGPKARRKTCSSRGKSLPPKRDNASGPRGSAAVHQVQLDLPSFGDETGMGDNDPAVENTVVKLSAAGSDAPAIGQEKEARSVGGISSR
ncbi:MAG: transposase [Candidatus Thorarchaeota archaeon]|nr:transposase [Candidatus Thorarchaeota archaeon]